MSEGSLDKDILNLEEAALLLGISLKTFQKVLREGDIPGRKIGREWKFSRRALIDWVGSSRSRDFRDLGDEPRAEIISTKIETTPLELEVEED
jgi:excisionase family DNA binding protein